MNAIKKQFGFALALFLIYYFVSTITYYLYGDPGTTIADAIYMTGISFTTVGYGDTGFASTETQKIIFTPLFIWGFLIQIIFVASAVNAFVALKIHYKIEELLMKILTKFKKKHIVIFGIGKISPHVIDELIQVRASFVVVGNSIAQIENLTEKYKKITAIQMHGRTLTEKVLQEVNIARASVAIFDLGSDELNHIAGDLVRRANPSIKIITVNDQLDFLPIMGSEGKTAINSHQLCAMRIASLAFRPSIVTYLDRMLYIQDGIYRIEEINIFENSSVTGKTIQDVFEKTHLQILVIGIQDMDIFDIIPRGKQVLQPGMTLFVQGEVSQIDAFRKLAEGEKTLSEF
jgi:voltage-gated potassium channel